MPPRVGKIRTKFGDLQSDVEAYYKAIVTKAWQYQVKCNLMEQKSDSRNKSVHI